MVIRPEVIWYYDNMQDTGGKEEGSLEGSLDEMWGKTRRERVECYFNLYFALIMLMFDVDVWCFFRLGAVFWSS